MVDPYIEKLVDLILNHSLTTEHEEGKFVPVDFSNKPLYVRYEDSAKELLDSITTRVQGKVIPEDIPWFEHGTVNRKETAASLVIQSESKTHSREDKKIIPRPIRKIEIDKTGHVDYRSCALVYPTEAYAKDAGMPFQDFRDYIWGAMLLKEKNPISAWQDVYKMQKKFMIDYLEGVKNIRIVDENEPTKTDLTMSVENHLWKPSFGRLNLPDNEIGNAPRKTSISGEFRTEIPQSYRGHREIRGLSLNFKYGIVTGWDAEDKKMKEFLDEFFGIPGTRYLGEFSLGMNSYIDKITKLLFVDEKMGGSTHLALGQAWSVHVPEGECRSQLHEECGEHWDIIKDMRGSGRYIEIEYLDKQRKNIKLMWNKNTHQWLAENLYS